MKAPDAAIPESLIEEVLREYSVGPPQSISAITTGLIHRTYLVRTADSKYILQRLHPDLSSDALLSDFLAVTDFLSSREFPSPKLICAANGRTAVDTKSGRFRMITYIDGVTHDSVTDGRMVAEAAAMLGRFHVALGEFRHTFGAGRPLHDSPKHFEAFKIAVDHAAGHPDLDGAREMIEHIHQHLPKHFLPSPLPSRVVHGDPKISNILFGRETHHAVGLVDLDSCSRHTVLVDIGDAVRSWCREGPEEMRSTFLQDRFRLFCEGYKTSGAALNSLEKKLAVQSCRLITLELASRFLRDVFEDRYFGWDSRRYSSRSAHNMARARGTMALFHSMMEQKDVMEEMIRDSWT